MPNALDSGPDATGNALAQGLDDYGRPLHPLDWWAQWRASQQNPLAQAVMTNPVGTEVAPGVAQMGMQRGSFDPLVAMGSNGQGITRSQVDATHAQLAQGAPLATSMVLGMVGDAPGGKPPGFVAYHGSPHSFDAFDASKIGTGEGAQAYGHGMYLADQEGIARGYRDKLSTNAMDGLNEALTDFSPYNPNGPKPTPDNLKVMLATHPNPHLQAAADNGDVVRDLYTMINGHDLTSNTWNGDAVKAASRLDTHFSGLPSSGHMYEVQVNADPAHFLDWDKPLSEQHPVVQDAVRQAWDTGGFGHPLPPDILKAPGSEIEQRLAQKIMAEDTRGNMPPPGYNARAKSSEALRDAGIPGIRYLDAGSRGAGEGTSNHVMFDANTMEILRKYGIAGLMLGGAGAGAASNYPQQ